MAKRVNLFNWLLNIKQVKFYGKTVIDGKAITSKKYRDAFSAIEWGEKQLSGAHVPMNVQLF